MLLLDELREVIEYDPETGKLFWKDRPLTMFRSERAQLNWNRKNSGREAFTTPTDKGYLQGTIKGTTWLAHRLAWYLATGEWPRIIDHENRDPKDNRLSNLRNGTQRQNMRNRKMSSRNTSGVMGVSRNRAIDKWTAVVGSQFLGSFDCFFQAVKARKAAEIEHGYHVNHGR